MRPKFLIGFQVWVLRVVTSHLTTSLRSSISVRSPASPSSGPDSDLTFLRHQEREFRLSEKLKPHVATLPGAGVTAAAELSVTAGGVGEAALRAMSELETAQQEKMASGKTKMEAAEIQRQEFGKTFPGIFRPATIQFEFLARKSIRSHLQAPLPSGICSWLCRNEKLQKQKISDNDS